MTPQEFLSRHLRRDWGDLCQDDKEETLAMLDEACKQHSPLIVFCRRNRRSIFCIRTNAVGAGVKD
jgi:hypothetical protein